MRQDSQHLAHFSSSVKFYTLYLEGKGHLPLSPMVRSSISQFVKKYWMANLKSFSCLQFPYHRSEYYLNELEQIMSGNVKIREIYSFSWFVLTKLSVDADIAKIAGNLVSPVTIYQSLRRRLE